MNPVASRMAGAVGGDQWLRGRHRGDQRDLAGIAAAGYRARLTVKSATSAKIDRKSTRLNSSH